MAALSTGVALAIRHTGFASAIEAPTIDARFALRGTQRPDRKIVLVALDEDSLGALPTYPFSRLYHAKVISELHAAGARLIVYDFEFDHPTNARADDALANAAAGAAPVVFGTTLIDNGQTEVLGGNASLRSLGAYPAAALLPADSDGGVRHLAASVYGLPTIASVVRRILTGDGLSAAAVASSGGWIDYAGPEGTYPSIHFVDVVRGRFDRSEVRGRVVIVGATARVLHDQADTPVDGTMPGVEVQANAIATALNGLPLRNPAGWVDILLIVALTLVICAAAYRLESLAVAALGVGLIVAWGAASVVAFDGGTVLAITPEVVALLLATGGALTLTSWGSSRERRRLRALFADASPAVVDHVLRTGGGAALSPTEVVAGYRMEQLIAAGGMGVVYRARQLELERTVAVKLIRPERALDADYRARFEQEGRIAAAVEHPNIIPVYQTGQDEGLLFIAMRFVHGVDLGQLLQAGGALDPHRTARVIEQLAGALDAAHEQHLVHRDVKPANVLLTLDEPEHVYLTDFGVAKPLGGGTGLTLADGWVGTPDYVAPEQIQGGAVDGRADVYALAGVLFHCLTGAPPYPRDTPIATIWAHVNEPAPSARALVPELGPEIDAVVAIGLAKDPGARYRTAADLAIAAAGALGIATRLVPSRPGLPPLPVPAPAPPASAGPDDQTVATG